MNKCLHIILPVITIALVTGTAMGQSMPAVKTFFKGIPTATQVRSQSVQKVTGGRRFLVNNADELIAVAAKCKDGDIINLGPGKFDFTKASVLEINKRVTLQGTYNINTRTGTTVMTGRIGHQPVIKLTGAGSRFYNIWMKGPDTMRRTAQMKELYKTNQYYSIPNTRGLSLLADDMKVMYCEFSGWSESAIYIENAKDVEIMNNYIHHNQREGLGYGVCLNKASARIFYNYFDWNRHDIAGTGRAGTSFIAEYNVVGSNKSSHSFDMHKIKDESLNEVIAGDSITIRNNWVYVRSNEFVRISGPARYYVSIDENHLIDTTKQKIVILGKSGKEKVFRNQPLKNNGWLQNFRRKK